MRKENEVRRDPLGARRGPLSVIRNLLVPFSPKENSASSLRAFWRFAGLTFAISWLCWIPIAFTRQNALNTEFIFLLLLGACGPSLAGLFLAYREGGQPALKAFARRAFELHFSARWWVVILLIWPVLFGLAAILASRLGGYPYPYSPLWTIFNAQPVMILPQVLVFLFWGPLSEEYGWRGYAQERILGSLGAFRTALLIGGVWALWQLPLIFITGTAESNLRPALFLLNILGLGVIYAALYNASGHQLGAVIALHFFYNLTLGFVPLLDPVTFACLVGLVYGIAVPIGVRWAVKRT